MRWGAPSIAAFLTDAGWPRRPIPALVAVALAASGGHDSYDARCGVPGAGHWRGLWGLDTDRYPDYAGVDLNDPRAAAAVTYRISAREHSLRWSPVFCSGYWLHYYDHAIASMAYPPYQETTAAPNTAAILELHRRG